jgi:uncharacterized protein (DUF1697 family)
MNSPMKKFIILFKGVNVGGKKLLPMKALVSLLEQHNYHDVSSYIQSGNIVLRCENEPTEKLKAIIDDNFGFSPEVFVLDESQWLDILQANPFKTFEGKFVHFYFCHNPIEINAEKLTNYIASTEAYFVQNNVFYLHAPDGIGRSKLVSNIDSCLGQVATGRNLNTTNKIAGIIANT